MIRLKRRVSPSILLLAMGLVVLGVFANEGLRAIRRRLDPVRLSGLSGLSSAGDDANLVSRALDQVSLEFRRVAADVLWFKLDKYVHEGPRIRHADGKVGVGYAWNLDIVPLYRLITWLDPHFIEAYRLAGTHILNTLNRPRDALRMWEEGIRNNRGSVRRKELLGEIAVYYMRDLNEYAKARDTLLEALGCYSSGGGDSGVDVFDREKIVGLLIVASYKAGDVETAIRYSREASTLEHDHPVLVDLARIERERGAAGPARPGVGPSVVTTAHDDRDHDHEGHDHADVGGRRGDRASGPTADIHERPWMEADRVARLQGCLILVLLADIVWLAVRARRGRGPARG